jgi:hypothetical protein
MRQTKYTLAALQEARHDPSPTIDQNIDRDEPPVYSHNPRRLTKRLDSHSSYSICPNSALAFSISALPRVSMRHQCHSRQSCFMLLELALIVARYDDIVDLQQHTTQLRR